MMGDVLPVPPRRMQEVRVGNLVIVKRFFPLSLILKSWVGEITEELWPTDWGQKFYMVRAANGKDYCVELGRLRKVSPLEALAQMGK